MVAPSLTDDNAVLAQRAGAVFTVNSATLYQPALFVRIGNSVFIRTGLILLMFSVGCQYYSRVRNAH